jgi:hypothetical protein
MQDGRWLSLIELTFTFGVVLLWAFRELWLLRRDRRRREAEKNRQRGEG